MAAGAVDGLLLAGVADGLAAKLLLWIPACVIHTFPVLMLARACSLMNFKGFLKLCMATSGHL